MKPDAAQLISQVYVGYYNRAPDAAGLNYWVGRYNAGMSLGDIAQSFSVQTESLNNYAYLANPNVASASTFLTAVYANLFNRAPDADGLAYWTAQLSSGKSTVGNAIINIISGAQDTAASKDLTTITNKMTAGLNWATTMANIAGAVYDSTAAASAKAIVAAVTSDAATVTAAATSTSSFFQNGSPGTTYTLTKGIDVINLTDEQQALLLEIPDPIFRESVRDFIVNQQFRRDYWVKGARKLSLFEKTENLRLVRVVLTTYPQDVELKVTGSLGQANMTEAIYGPILASLSDHKIKTIAQIEQATSPLGINFAQLIQAILLLAGAGHLSLAQDEAAVAKARKHSDKINLHLLNKSRGDGDVGYLASPVTGGGVMIGRFQQLFLLAIKQGKKQSIEWAQFSWNILLAQGQQLVKDGVTIETSEGCLAELTTLAKSFEDKQMPILRALQII